MAASKRTQDFEGRFFDQLDENFKDLKGDIKETRKELKDNTKATAEGFKGINGRLRKVEDVVFTAPVTAKNLPSFWRDPAVLGILRWVVLAILIGVAAWAGFDIKGLL